MLLDGTLLMPTQKHVKFVHRVIIGARIVFIETLCIIIEVYLTIETFFVRKLMGTQLALSEEERDRIMQEHEKQMVKLENR